MTEAERHAVDTQFFTRWAVLVALVCAAGCVAGSHPPDLASLPAKAFTGHYTGGPRGSWFRACSAPALISSTPDSTPSDAWWVTFVGHAGPQADSARAANHLSASAPTFVRWQAAVTRGGEVGPRGPGATALLVRDILEMRPATPGDCEQGDPDGSAVR